MTYVVTYKQWVEWYRKSYTYSFTCYSYEEALTAKDVLEARAGVSEVTIEERAINA